LGGEEEWIAAKNRFLKPGEFDCFSKKIAFTLRG